LTYINERCFLPFRSERFCVSTVVGKIFALNVAHYRYRYGDVSIAESLEMLRTEKVGNEMA